VILSAWLPVPGVPDGAMLLGHVAQANPSEVKRVLDQRPVTGAITPVIVQTSTTVAAHGGRRGTAAARPRLRAWQADG
jgi:hypothetical protein